MINLVLILMVAVILIASNYTAFGYGLKIGKAMQEEIPEPPTTEIAKKTVKLVKGMNKSYIQKKEPKEEIGMFD